MKNILKLNAISKMADDCFDETYLLSNDTTTPVGIMVRSFNMHDYVLPPTVLAVARAGAGVNNIPTDEYAKQGVVVFNTPGANANAVKELVMSALFLGSRKIVDSIKWVDTLKGNGDDIAKMVEKGKKDFVGPEILGKTLGIVGLGAIGIRVANAAIALGMNVVGYDPYLSVDNALILSQQCKRVNDLDELYKVSDYITLHVPLLKENASFINKDSIAKMKDGVVLINTARGELFDIPALIEGIEDKKIGGLAMDVFEGEDGIYHENRLADILRNHDMAYLRQFPNVILTPHMAFYTQLSMDSMVQISMENLMEFNQNGTAKNEIII